MDFLIRYPSGIFQFIRRRFQGQLYKLLHRIFQPDHIVHIKYELQPVNDFLNPCLDILKDLNDAAINLLCGVNHKSYDFLPDFDDKVPGLCYGVNENVKPFDQLAFHIIKRILDSVKEICNKAVRLSTGKHPIHITRRSQHILNRIQLSYDRRRMFKITFRHPCYKRPCISMNIHNLGRFYLLRRI